MLATQPAHRSCLPAHLARRPRRGGARCPASLPHLCDASAVLVAQHHFRRGRRRLRHRVRWRPRRHRRPRRCVAAHVATGSATGLGRRLRQGRTAAVCVRRWRGARPQTRRRVICLSAHASYVCRLYFIHTYVYVDCSVCPARLRRGQMDRRAASAARPLRLVFAFGCCVRASAHKIGRTGRGLARKFVILSTRRP